MNDERALIALREFCKQQGVPEEKIKHMDLRQLEDYMVKEELMFR